MSDLQQHIQERKSWDADFAAGFDAGYALFNQIYEAKTTGQAITLWVIFEQTEQHYLGYLRDSPTINVHGATLAEVRAKLAQEVVDMLDPEWVQVEGNLEESNWTTENPERVMEVFVVLTGTVGRWSKRAGANQRGRKKTVLAEVG
jgi:hypothetical protein